VTAAFVLLCHVYCACGAAHALVARAATSAEESSALPPCHRHHGGGKSESGKPAAPGHDGGSCQHCRPSVATAGTGNVTITTQLNPSQVPPTPFVVPVAYADVLIRRHSTGFSDLPPPQLGQTLLGLHCALNS
jgi:hypothetical protein